LLEINNTTVYNST